MSTVVSVDESRCSGCGLCAEVCPGFTRDAQIKVPKLNTDWYCSRCGHCVAACPADAVTHSLLNLAEFEPIDRDLLPSYEQVLALLKSRRSRREFKKQPIPRDVIEKLLKAAITAPAAMNKPSVHFTVVTDPEMIRELSEMGANSVRKLGWMIRNVIGKQLLRVVAPSVYKASSYLLAWVKPILTAQETGQDMVLYSAPAVILVHCSKLDLCASENALYSAGNILTTAETLDLGACVIGFITETIGNDRTMRRKLNIPRDHAIFTTIALGYPRFSYPRSTPKEPPKVHWIEQ